MAKLVLDTMAMQEDFFEESAMLGIATALPAYHLCWLFNNHLEVNFVRDPEMNITSQKKDDQYFFPVYKYDLPNSSHRYLLYKLKNGVELLLPETKQLDYLWMVQTADPTEDVKRIANGVRNMPDIQLAQIFAPGQLKNLNNLLI